MTTTLKILVADDLEPNLKLVLKHLERAGHDVSAAMDGVEAFELYQQDEFDLVLLDVMMPKMNGHEVAKKIKAMDGNNWTPIIFLSALNKGDDVVKGLEVGGDDYLPKPIDLNLLDAKIMSMLRIADIQRELEDKTARLERASKLTAEENLMANQIMQRIIHVPEEDNEVLRHWVLPADCFSGDMVAAVRDENERLYIMHADSTGHGLSAAIPLLPVSQTFYAMAQKSFSLPSIVREINKRTRSYVPTERFVAASMLCIDFRNRLVEVWNGGCPDVLYVDDDGHVIQTFGSEHMAFGILPDQAFDSRTRVMQWQSSGQLLMYSDGLIESRNNEGKMFGEEGVIESLSTHASNDMFLGLVDDLALHMGSDIAQDDISIVMARCS